MAMKVYVISDRDMIGFVEENDFEGFKEYMAENATMLLDEPVEFQTEEEALAFCAGIGYGVDDRNAVEELPLRSWEENDKAFIGVMEEYL